MASAPKFEPRRAAPGQVFDYTTAQGRQRHLRADAEGVVQPKDADDEVVLKRFGLGVHQPAKQAAKAEAKATEKKAAPKDEPKQAPKEGDGGSE